MQNVRDFPQTKLHNGINSPLLLNEHGDPRFVFQLFAKNSLMKIISEEEQSLIVEHMFWGKKVPNWVCFGQGEDLSKIVQFSHNQAVKNGLNEATLLTSINEALLSRRNFVPFKPPRFNTV